MAALARRLAFRSAEASAVFEEVVTLTLCEGTGRGTRHPFAAADGLVEAAVALDPCWAYVEVSASGFTRVGFVLPDEPLAAVGAVGTRAAKFFFRPPLVGGHAFTERPLIG